MAKKSMIEREKKRIRLEKKYALKRTNLLNDYRNEKSFNEKLEIHSQIQQLPRNSAKTRIRNRCWKTGRPRGVFSDFGLSLIKNIVILYYLKTLTVKLTQL